MKTRSIHGLLAISAGLALALGACAKPAGTDTPRRTSNAGPSDPGAGRPAAQGDSYTIKFDRPLAVGLKARIVANGMVDTKTTVNGKIHPAQTGKITYAYEAIVTVKGVHACGKATGLEMKIVKLQMTKGGATQDLLPAGTIVLAETAGKAKKFSVNGKPVDKATDKVLGYVTSLYSGDSTSTDEVFGPGGPKKPGDSWKVNVANLLAGLKARFEGAALWPEPADVTSKVTFVATKKVEGLDVLEVDAKIKLNNIAPKMGPVKATAGWLEIGMSGWLPKDPKVVNNDFHTQTMRLHIEGDIKKGAQTIKLVVDVNQVEKKRTSPVK